MKNPINLSVIEQLSGEQSARVAKRRAAGGARSRSGNDYEENFAIRRLAELAAAALKAGTDGSDAWIECGVVTLVDDLFVFDGKTFIYSQAKKGAISRETVLDALVPAFEEQKQVAQALRRQLSRDASLFPGHDGKIKISLELVVSYDTVRTNIRRMLHPRRWHRIVVHEEMRYEVGPTPSSGYASAFAALTPKLLRSRRYKSVPLALLAAWRNVGRKGTPREIIEHASEFSCGFLQTLGPPYALSPRVEKILNEAYDLRYHIVGRNFFFRLEKQAVWVSPRVLCGSPEWSVFEGELQEGDTGVDIFVALTGL